MKIDKITISYVAIVAVLIITAFFSLNLFFRQRSERDVVSVKKMPLVIGEWKGKDTEVTEKEYDILETRNLVSREYTNAKGQSIYLFIIYSETNRSVIHPPEVCMMGGGMEITKKVKDTIELSGKTFFLNKLYLEKGSYKQLVLYAYKAGKLYTDSYPLQQAHFALNQLFGKNKGGATVRVSMELGASEEKTLAALKGFMKQAVEQVERLH